MRVERLYRRLRCGPEYQKNLTYDPLVNIQTLQFEDCSGRPDFKGIQSGIHIEAET